MLFRMGGVGFGLIVRRPGCIGGWDRVGFDEGGGTMGREGAWKWMIVCTLILDRSAGLCSGDIFVYMLFQMLVHDFIDHVQSLY